MNKAPGLLNLSPEEMAQLSHAALYMARARAPKEQQNQLAGYEHRAFAREATEENPMMALPIAAGTVGWPLYKMLMSPGRSDPSFNQVGQGLLGVGEGVSNRLRGLLR
jgi:hypothetical protein